ncbi:MAG TPA: hypothetical protein DC054_09315 [Blastocatellia bacterium]|nr:hypothetical protein [Blastocatellia bacterium]
MTNTDLPHYQNRQRIEVVTIDMAAPFRDAIREA